MLEYFAIGLALISLITVLFCLLLCTKALPTSSKLNVLRSEVGDTLERMESLETRVRRLSSKVAMRKKREEERKPNGFDDDGEIPDARIDPEGWKKAMRIKLALGRVK